MSMRWRVGAALLGILALAAFLPGPFAAQVPKAFAEGADGRSAQGVAAAVLTDAGELVLLRTSERVEPGDNRRVTDICGYEWTGTAYVGIEEEAYHAPDGSPWAADWQRITSARVADGCLVRPTSCAWLFSGLSNMQTCDLSGLDTTGVSSFHGMFNACRSLAEIDLGPLSTASATDMGSMFRECGLLRSVDLSALDTSSVTDFSHMFHSCGSLAELGLIGVDTSSATDLCDMFALCSRLREVDASGFETGLVEDFSEMFLICDSLETLDISSFDTSSATNMREMLGRCDSLASISLGQSFSFRGAGIEDRLLCATMPSGAGNGYWQLDGSPALMEPSYDFLSSYDGATMAGTWVVVTGVTHAITYDLGGGHVPDGETWPDFYVEGRHLELPGSGGSYWGEPEREGYSFEGWENQQGKRVTSVGFLDMTDVTLTALWWPLDPGEGTAYAVLTADGTLAFVRSWERHADGPSQAVTDLSGDVWEGEVFTGVETQAYPYASQVPWYGRREDVQSFCVEEGQTVTLKDLAWVFCGLSNMQACDLTGIDSSAATSMVGTFHGCSSLASIDLSPLDTSGVTDMGGTFSGCSSLASIDLSPLDTSKVTSMGDITSSVAGYGLGMLGGCSSLASVDLSCLDTHAVTDMSFLLAGCSGLRSATLDGLDTSSATSMQGLFYGCQKLTSLDLSRLDTHAVRSFSYAFSGCAGLRTLDISGWDTRRSRGMSNMFQGCANLREVTLGELFSFRGNDLGDSSSAILPNPSDAAPFDGTWRLAGSEAIDPMAASAVREAWDERALPGTWVWNAAGENNLVIDLVGGAAPDGQAYPTSYEEGSALALPGREGSALGVPTRVRHEFVGWVDECGDPIAEIGADSVGVRMVRATWRPTGRGDEGHACAVVTDGGELVLLRTYGGEVLGKGGSVTDITGRTWRGEVFAWDEDGQPGRPSDIPWRGRTGSVSAFLVADGCTVRPASCAWMLNGFYRLTRCDLTGLDTSRATSMCAMFRSCSSLTEIDLTPLDTSCVTDMSAMFCECNGLTSLDCSSFDVSRVRLMGSLPEGMVTYYGGGMFYDCYRLSNLDLTGWDTSSVEDMSQMFVACASFRHIPTEWLDTSSCTDMSYMFANCWRVTSMDLSNFDTSKVTRAEGMFSGCDVLAFLDISSFDTTRVESMYAFFSGDSKLREVRLGEGFTFVGANHDLDRYKAYLRRPPVDDVHDGTWCREWDVTTALTADELTDHFEGRTMAGTWVWTERAEHAISYDLDGGSAPEDLASWPRSYTTGTATPLPGSEGSGLAAPARGGYDFGGWESDVTGTILEVPVTCHTDLALKAHWVPQQIRVSVPVAATLVAKPAPDGTLALTYPGGDFDLAVANDGTPSVTATARAEAATGYTLSGDGAEPSDIEADVWMTPVTTGADPTEAGYDPADDEAYQEHGAIRLSRLGEGTQVGPRLESGSTLWLNGVGGVMDGWDSDAGAAERLLTIAWTFAIA